MKVAHNILANLAGTFWGTAVGLVVVPIYLRLIGAEGYGLVGFYAVLSGLLSVLDGGFSAAASRQLARSDSEVSGRGASMGKMLQTLEWLFFGIAVVAGLFVVGMAPILVSKWLNVQKLSAEGAILAVRLMGLILIVQFPLALYNGCLMGMQRQVLLNGINGVIATFRALGGVAVLLWVSPTVEAFFAWQALITGVNLAWAGYSVHRLIPDRAAGGRFEFTEIRRLSSFAVGMGGINMLGLIVTQLDKVVLSWLLPLQQFGYYVLAWTLATIIYRLAGPVFGAVLPRMTQLTAAGPADSWGSFFQKSAQLMAVLIVPFSLFMGTFAEDIVLLWTHDIAIAHADRWVLALLAIGTMLNGIVQIPYSLHIAQGRIRPIFTMSLLVLVVAAPIVYFLAMTFGSVGAASVWVMVNFAYLCTIAALTLPLIGRAELKAWLWHSVAKPVALSGLLLIGLKAIVGDGETMPRMNLLVQLAAAGIVCQLFVGALVPFSREKALGALRQVIRRLVRGRRPVDNGG